MYADVVPAFTFNYFVSLHPFSLSQATFPIRRGPNPYRVRLLSQSIRSPYRAHQAATFALVGRLDADAVSVGHLSRSSSRGHARHLSRACGYPLIGNHRHMTDVSDPPRLAVAQLPACDLPQLGIHEDFWV